MGDAAPTYAPSLYPLPFTSYLSTPSLTSLFEMIWMDGRPGWNYLVLYSHFSHAARHECFIGAICGVQFLFVSCLALPCFLPCCLAACYFLFVCLMLCLACMCCCILVSVHAVACSLCIYTCLYMHTCFLLVKHFFLQNIIITSKHTMHYS